MKTRRLDPAKASVFLQKAERFAAASRAAQASSHWDPAVSLAVHAGISAFDALCVSRLGRRAAADAHEEAVDLLGEIRNLAGHERRSIAQHLKALLAVKHLAEYEDRLCDERDAANAVLQMGRLLERVRNRMGT